jgi:DNA polymerase-3 subunit delta'
MVQAGSRDSLINAELAEQIIKFAENTQPQTTLAKMDAIMSARDSLQRNGAPLLVMESLMCELIK